MGSRGDQKSKGKNVSQGGSNPEVERLVKGFAGTKLDHPSQDDGGEWEVISKRNKNKPANPAAKSWASSPNQNPPRPWGGQQQGRGNNAYGRGNARGTQPTARGAGRGQPINRGYGNNYVAPPPAARPPLEGGWNWQSRAGSAQHTVTEEVVPDVYDDVDNVSEGDDDCDTMDDSDEDLASDDYDSDASQQSHGTRKQNKWFKKFFDSLDSLSIEQINEPQRQWHCPACQGGPGAIDWYNLQPLIAHARTKGARRVKLHRELAEVLDKDLQMRGASVIPCGEIYGQWKGLGEEEKDREIVWPPMVIIMNTRLDKDDNDKWLGMGNNELLDYFNEYPAQKARHSYGPQGHRGMSVLIFESSANGYIEAECLHKDLAEQGLDRNAWDRRRSWFTGGVRQLYGFLATKQDLDAFNQHCHGKTRLKYEMKSYQENVVKELRQISEDNQQLNWFKNKLSRKSKDNKVLVESLGILSEKLRQTTEDNRIVRQRTKMQHEQNKEEMDSQDKFFKETFKQIHEKRDAKEENFEMLQQQERAKVVDQQKNTNLSSKDEIRKRAEEISSFIKDQENEMEEFVEEREKLIEEQEKKMAEMKRRHFEEMLELEREFDESLEELMSKHGLHDAYD